MKGQISIEYLIVVGVVLILVIPLFFYSTSKTTTNLRINQADDTVTSLVTAADSVYSLGPGSKDYVWITIPKGTKTSSITGQTIQLQLSIFSGTSDVHKTTKANVSGTLPTEQGTYKISVEMLEDGTILIGNST